MTDRKHTPGPWKKVKFSEDQWRCPMREDSMTTTGRLIHSEEGEAVAMAVTAYPSWTDEEKEAELEANARLIAAAPELLEALKGLLNYENLGAYARSDVRKQARAAIAKATGD